MNSFALKTAPLLGAVLLAALPARAQVVLTASSWVPQNHALAVTQARWCEDVAKATANRVRCNLLPRAVASPTATFDAVRDGLADLSYSVHGYTPGRYVLTKMAELPFGGDSAERMSAAYQKIHEKHFAKIGEHKGLKVLAVFVHGPGSLYSTKRPVTSLADMQGMRVRISGGMVNDVAQALGLAGTVKPSSDTYELLSSGVLDGTLMPAETIESFKLDKLVKYRTTFPGGLYNTSFALVMNEGTWQRIPKVDQQIIEQLSGVHAARMFGRAWDEADRRGNAFLQAANVPAVAASPRFIEEVKGRIAPLEQRWVTEAQGRGLANPAQVLKEFRSEIGKD